ncbi:MAG TPA: tetratricopeptide repeat protein [Thermomicrobiales bacterium]|nr:tetratricopeptide repeat protein [Thermomicrobiales bacterium]
MAGRNRRPAATSRPFTLLAVVIIIFLLASSLLILIPFGSDGDDGSIDDDVLRVTPGAEVSRLETVISENPGDVDSIVVLSEVLANSGRIAESIPWFERAIQQRPDDATLRLAFGRALQRAGNNFDAELQLKRAVELEPGNPANAFYLGLFYENREPRALDQAHEWYQRAIDADPESVIAGQARDRMAALDPAATPTGTP